MSKFQTRHYEVIARTIRDQFERWYTVGYDSIFWEDVLDKLTEDLVVAFKADNPHFDPEKFREAIG